MTAERSTPALPGPPHDPSDLAGPPPADVAVPNAVRRVAGGRALVPVWRNGLGGLTFRLVGNPRAAGAGEGDRFVKWAPSHAVAELGLEAEATRLAWAAAFTPVPRVLDAGSDDDGAWLVTEALAGLSAVDARWLADPRTAVRAVGEGLRALHDALPVAGCPFDWEVGGRLDRADARASALEPVDGVPSDDAPSDDAPSDDAPSDGRRRSDIRAALRESLPELDRLVVCHGDPCAPNTLVGDDGRWSGHVDLGALGVADRWADLAVATWSTRWNYGPGWEGELLAAYGIAPDPERTAYYRAVWDAT